jgi:hypothetical protein
MERFNIKKLNDVEGKEQHRVEISNRFAALEHLDVEADINKLGKLLDRISKFQPKRVLVIMNSRSISHGSTKDAQNY